MRGDSDEILEPFVVSRECMGFLLSPGDKILVRRESLETLSLGDIVVILYDEEPGALAVHRLMWKRRLPGGWRVWTKGDVPSRLDSPLAGSGVVGKVVFCLRRGRSGAWDSLEGARGRMRHLLIGGLSWLFYDAYRLRVQARWLPALYRLAGRARGLRPLRRLILEASLLAGA